MAQVDSRGGVRGGGRPPHLPQPGEGHRLSVPPVDGVGKAPGRAAVAPRAALPFVKSVGRNETAPPFQGGPKGGLLVDALGPGVDHPAADRRILGPRGHQPPAEGPEGPAGTLYRVGPAPDGHGVHVQGGGHVVAGRQGLGADLLHLEHVRQLGERRRGGVAPAHRSTQRCRTKLRSGVFGSMTTSSLVPVAKL